MLLNIKTNINKISRTDTLTDYYNDVQKYDLLSESEERELFKELRYNEGIMKMASEANDAMLYSECEAEATAIRTKIANANLRFVISIARVYATNSDISDLISEGNIGLMEAIDKFDIEKENKFSTFAVYYVRRQINFFRQDVAGPIRKNNISKTFHVTSKLINKFMQENGREPSSDELMIYMNEEFPKLGIKDHTDLMPLEISSIDVTCDKSDDWEGNTSCMAEYNDKSASFNLCEVGIENDHLKTMISSMIRSLNENDARILKMHFGIGSDDSEGMSAIRIAQVTGLCEEDVTKSISRSIKALKKKYGESLRKI